LSRYLLADDMAAAGMRQAAGGTNENYDRDIKLAIRLAGAIGKVVDGLLLGLLNRPGLKISHRVYAVVLESALVKGQREAVARRIVPPAQEHGRNEAAHG
jgi:hypothetical protein